jgi:hypothetical protein
MARGRCQIGAEAFAGPWDERDNSYVALVHNEDDGVRELRQRRGAQEPFTGHLPLVLASLCRGERLLAYFELYDHARKRSRAASFAWDLSLDLRPERACDFLSMTASTRWRISADQFS